MDFDWKFVGFSSLLAVEVLAAILGAVLISVWAQTTTPSATDPRLLLGLVILAIGIIGSIISASVLIKGE